jgi:aspartate/glutamate racemase
MGKPVFGVLGGMGGLASAEFVKTISQSAGRAFVVETLVVT